MSHHNYTNLSIHSLYQLVLERVTKRKDEILHIYSFFLHSDLMTLAADSTI